MYCSTDAGAIKKAGGAKRQPKTNRSELDLDAIANELDGGAALDLRKDKSSWNKGDIYKPMEEVMDVVKHPVKFQRQAKDEDAFAVDLAEREELNDIMFIHSGIGFLREYLTFLWEKDPRLQDRKYTDKFEGILSKMVFFITRTEDKDPFLCEGLPIRNL